MYNLEDSDEEDMFIVEESEPTPEGTTISQYNVNEDTNNEVVDIDEEPSQTASEPDCLLPFP